MELKEETLKQSISLKLLTDKFIKYTNELIPEDIEEKEQIKTAIARFKIYVKRYIENLRNNNEIECSFLLGSILEVTLQLFLYSYIKDYNKTNWKKWDINIDKLKQEMAKYINSLDLDSKQKNTLKDIIKQELKVRKTGKRINEIMLDELIGLYKSEGILRLVPENDKDLDELEPLTYNESIRKLLNMTPEEETEAHKEYIEYEKEKRNKERKREQDTLNRMTAIKNNRNNIHIFTKNNLETIETIIDLTQEYLLVLDDLTYRLECTYDEKYKKKAKKFDKKK